jgi:isocitrate dehydrogenase
MRDEAKIVEELNAVQGVAMDIEGYYSPNLSKATEAMRPSPTLNAIVDAI